jgi:cadmium resistance protein CadD (predicted permease)
MDPVRYREQKKAHGRWELFWWLNALLWLSLSWTVVGLIPLYVSIRKALKHDRAKDDLTEQYEESTDDTDPSTA